MEPYRTQLAHKTDLSTVDTLFFKCLRNFSIEKILNNQEAAQNVFEKSIDFLALKLYSDGMNE